MLRAFGFCAAVVAGSWMCCLSGSAADAPKADAPKKERDPAKFFQKKDADSDGFLTLEEFKAGMPERFVNKADERFKKLDTNGDSKLSLDEFKAGLQDRPKRKKP